jgi:hypothetical protein
MPCIHERQGYRICEECGGEVNYCRLCGQVLAPCRCWVRRGAVGGAATA